MSLFPSAHPHADAIATQDAGCGWFESSYDLQHGLMVREEMDAVGLALWFRANRARWSHATAPAPGARLVIATKTG